MRSRVLVRTSAALDLRMNQRVFDASFEEYLQRRGASPGQALSDLAASWNDAGAAAPNNNKTRSSVSVRFGHEMPLVQQASESAA